MANPTASVHPAVSHFKEPYREFAKTLRTWLVAYGIGVPVLFASQDKLADKVAASGYGRQIIVLLLVGVAIQIASAFLYKTAMWYLYCGELTPEICGGKRYRFADWISMQYWLELLFDVSAVTLFVIGTWRLLDVVLA
jgi:hypothetical protein